LENRQAFTIKRRAAVASSGCGMREVDSSISRTSASVRAGGAGAG
jgi:hypothetical protein